MKKTDEKQLFYIRYFWLKQLIMTKLCILFLLFSITAVSAGTLNTEAIESDYVFRLKGNTVDLQQIAVSGTVKDAVTGEALTGVTVIIKGTTLGTLTDINGQFTLLLPQKEAFLSFSFIGYSTQEVKAVQGTNISVAMQLELTQISEVVVVGYGTQKKESMVGAITQVNNASLVKSGASNVTNAIAGKLSGVLTIQQTSEPGNNASEIIIRGVSSWSGSAPLILIDGVERDFRDMDPNEINTISVLKDASATAVFGAKGANGVIIVTTKRGYLGKPQMTFTSSTGIQVPTSIPPHIDSYSTMSMLNVARMNSQSFDILTSQSVLNEYRNPSSPLKALQYPDVNWFDVNAKAFAPQSNANISVAGGTDFVKYFVSLGYLHEGSFFKQDKQAYISEVVDSRFWYNRYNLRTNLDFNLTKTTQLSLNVGGEVGTKNNPENVDIFWRTFYGSTGTQFPAYWPAWTLEQIPDTDYPGATGIRRAESYNSWYRNPYNYVNTGDFERYLNTKLFTDLILDQKLDFIIKGLSARGKVAYNSYYSHLSLFSTYPMPNYRILFSRVGVDANNDGQVDQNPWERGDGGESIEYFYPLPLRMSSGGVSVSENYSGQKAFYSDLYYEMSLNYGNTFGKHTVTGLALMNREQRNMETEFPYFNAAFVGRTTYDYANKYLLEVNIGYTGSERFDPNNRYGFFPSGAIGWVVSQESFFKNAVPWMNKLKVRYSDGLVGSDYAANRWLYISDYAIDSRGYIHEDLGANESAQWEEARKKDLGIEVGIFKNLFSFSVDLFDEYRSKMLLAPRTTTFLIGNGFKDLNLGSLKKHGIELEVEFNKTTINRLNYFIKGNFGFSENRVLFKDDPIYSSEYTKVAGKPLDAQLKGAITTGTGYYTSVNDIHINPTPVPLEKLYVGDYKFLDYRADGTININDNYPISGTTYAPIVYSVTSGISYKGFDFNMMFQGAQGGYLTLSVSEIEFQKGTYRVHEGVVDYWKPDNQDAGHSTLHFNEADLGDAIHSWGEKAWLNHFWREASYLRLKEIYAGYNFNPEFLKRGIGVSNMLIYVNGTNLLTFTKLIREFDPEVKNFGSGWYPQLSRYNIGLKVSF